LISKLSSTQSTGFLGAAPRRRSQGIRTSRTPLSFAYYCAFHSLLRTGIEEVVSADRFFNLVAYTQSDGECLELIRRLQSSEHHLPAAPQILQALSR
jgi:hypothetical protein